MPTTLARTDSPPTPGTRVVWVTLLLPPLFFLLAIVAVSVAIGIAAGTDAGANAQAIAEEATRATPVILLIAQVLMALLLLGLVRAGRWTWPELGWRLAPGQTLAREVLLGGGVGIGLAVLYLAVLSPLMVTLQRTVGDYVPAGSLLPALGNYTLPFFLANVVFAPFVEEALYRGYALPHFRQRYGPVWALVLVCVFFGLLHWAGGLWYVVLTGLVAGGAFGALYLRRGNLIAPFTAHLLLNGLEFVFVWLRLTV